MLTAILTTGLLLPAPLMSTFAGCGGEDGKGQGYDGLFWLT